MHDLKFKDVFPILGLRDLKEPSFYSPVCNDAARVYRLNMQLIHSLAMVPGYSFMNGENWGYAVLESMHTLRINNPDAPEVQAHAIKVWDDHDTRGFDDSSVKHFFDSTESAANMASLPGRSLSHDALHALLKSMIIQAWTSFEVLIKQLHQRSRQIHPGCFSHLNGNESFQFQKRETFRKPYSIAFQGDKAILNKLNDESVDALSELRNLFVHSGGIVDEDFRRRSRLMYSPAWAALPIGHPFECTGSCVRSLVDANLYCAHKLIELVDSWLQKNSTPP